MGWVLGSWPSPNTCLGMTGISSGASACISAGCGFLSWITAVCGSGVSTRSTASNIAMPKGWFALTVESENATSSDVIGWPSWKRAFSTRWKV